MKKKKRVYSKSFFLSLNKLNYITKPWKEIVYPSGQNYFSSQPLSRTLRDRDNGGAG